MKHSVRIFFSLTVLLLISTAAMAKTVISRPYFAGTNNNRLEIERVTLDRRATLLDVKIWQASGQVGIDPRATLRAGGVDYAYKGSAALPDGGVVDVPECGYVSATLRFSPLPEGTTELDFREVPDGSGWNVYGIRLDGKRPHVDLPPSLLNEKPAAVAAPPSVVPDFGKAVIDIRLLGYRPEYNTHILANVGNWFSPPRMPFDYEPVNADGTCRIEAYAAVPTVGNVEIGRCKIPLVVAPHARTTVTVSLPDLMLAQTHLFADEMRGATFVWFEGDNAAVDTELQGVKGSINMYGDTFYDDICGMDPAAYSRYVRRAYDIRRQAIASCATLGDASRAVAQSVLDMGCASMLLGYKANIAIAPMIARRKGVRRADLTVDSLAYFAALDSLPTLRTLRHRYYPYLADFASGFRRRYMGSDPLLDDIAVGKRLSRSLGRKQPLTAAQLDTARATIADPSVLALLLAENQRLVARLSGDTAIMAEARREAAQSSRYTIIDIAPTLHAADILPAIAARYKGRAILVDFWNTWCVPCRNAMKALLPLKDELKDVAYVYIADESSPVDKWNEAVRSISGAHVRITKQQAQDMARLYGFSGIPTYFVIDAKGEKTFQCTGFPGIDKLRQELGRH